MQDHKKYRAFAFLAIANVTLYAIARPSVCRLSVCL